MSDQSSLPPPPPELHEVCVNGICRNVTLHRNEIIIESASISVMSSIILAFVLIITKNRLWHSNKVINSFLENIEQPLSSLIGVAVLLILGFPYSNELYIVWAVILLLASHSILFFSGCGLADIRKMKSAYLQLFLYEIFDGFLIGFLVRDTMFGNPLWTLWALSTVKLFLRFIGSLATERRYTTEKSSLIADYMKQEHELSQHTDLDHSMQLYKYIVFGEDKVKRIVDTAHSQHRVKLDFNPSVVTTDQIWTSSEGFLSAELDSEEKFKDICLSFALFKLLRRRFLNYPAAEASQQKTRDFVFRVLLNEDKERVFRVIKTELVFYKDLLYSKHPIIFTYGLYTYNFILTFLTIGASGWLAKVTYHDYKHAQLNNDEVLNTTKTGKNIDLYVTYILVGLMIGAEIIEFCTYAFSDWARVIFIREYLRSSWLKYVPYFENVFVFCGDRSLLQSLSNRLGQYSLLNNYHASKLYHLYKLKYESKTLQPKLKHAIYDSLRNYGDRLSNGASTFFTGNGVIQGSSWDYSSPTDIHTIMIWHVATSYCEIIPLENKQLSHDLQEEVESKKIIATSLSKYCAYLVAFVPDILPGSGNTTRFYFNKIVGETRDFFTDSGKNNTEKYQKMNKVGDSTTIIGRGSRLGKQLEEMEIHERWKVLAEFWSDLIVYLAPSNDVTAHLNQLEDGGEFITHLWVILYHAGIIERQENHVFIMGESVP